MIQSKVIFLFYNSGLHLPFYNYLPGEYPYFEHPLYVILFEKAVLSERQLFHFPGFFTIQIQLKAHFLVSGAYL